MLKMLNIQKKYAYDAFIFGKNIIFASCSIALHGHVKMNFLTLI